MSYATQSDLEIALGTEKLVLLTDRINIPPTTINAVTVAAALDAANGMVDSYIGVQYALPLPVNAESQAALKLLRLVVLDIARYMLTTVAPDSDVTLKHEAALGYLRALQKGAALLPGISTGQPVSAGLVDMVPGDRAFGRRATR